MSIYIALISFTDKGMHAIKDSPKRAEKAIADASKHGLTVKDIYWTSGAYDGVLVLDAPDEASAASFFLSLAGAGNVRTQSMRAYDSAEFKQLLAKVD